MGSLDHIPGTLGLPLIGQTVPFLRDARTMVAERHREYGDVAKGRALGQTAVTFVSPEATKQIYLDPDRIFSSEIGWSFTIGPLFQRGLMLRDFEDHRVHRLAMAHAFRRAALQGYVPRIHEITQQHVARMGTGAVDVYALAKELTLDIAAQVFVGTTMHEQVATLNRCFVQMMRASISPLRLDLPGLPFRKGMAARRELVGLFTELVRQRRAEPEGEDLLSRLAHARVEDGRPLAVDEVVDHMIFLLLAAHDTTTATLAVMMWMLARHQTWQDAVVAEIEALGGDPVTLDNQGELVVTERVFKEALRMSPPVPFSPRGVLADTEIDGWAIPAGTMVTTCSLELHRHPAYWSHPNSFDPDRFAPHRAEDKQHSHLFIPFGGGAHLCLGNHFAELVAKAAMAGVLTSHRLEDVPGRQVFIQSVPIPKPRGGLVLTVR